MCTYNARKSFNNLPKSFYYRQKPTTNHALVVCAFTAIDTITEKNSPKSSLTISNFNSTHYMSLCQ